MQPHGCGADQVSPRGEADQEQGDPDEERHPRHVHHRSHEDGRSEPCQLYRPESSRQEDGACGSGGRGTQSHGVQDGIWPDVDTAPDQRAKVVLFGEMTERLIASIPKQPEIQKQNALKKIQKREPLDRYRSKR
jgi:hypothetical protein